MDLYRNTDAVTRFAVFQMADFALRNFHRGRTTICLSQTDKACALALEKRS